MAAVETESGTAEAPVPFRRKPRLRALTAVAATLLLLALVLPSILTTERPALKPERQEALNKQNLPPAPAASLSRPAVEARTEPPRMARQIPRVPIKQVAKVRPEPVRVSQPQINHVQIASARASVSDDLVVPTELRDSENDLESVGDLVGF
jgi:hypothetical protein